VNPAVASHGGEIGLVEVKDRKVYLRMSGGCQGCGSAKLTLSLGVQNSIREAIPAVLAVIDVTDHQAGTAPFYAKTDASHQIHI
jgi:Fe-S cluster biogenesis protein NfuA